MFKPTESSLRVEALGYIVLMPPELGQTMGLQVPTIPSRAASDPARVPRGRP